MSKESLAKDGWTKLETFFKYDECKDCINELNEYKDSNGIQASTSSTSSHIHNPFLISQKCKDLVFSEQLYTEYMQYLGDYYIMRNCVASNIYNENRKKGNDYENPIGCGWHRDSPQYYDNNGDSQTLGSSKTFQIIICLEDTDIKNSTEIVPKTHLWSYSAHRPKDEYIRKRLATTKSMMMKLKAGESMIIDDQLFHRAGTPSSKSRWLIFIGFCPWYIRPYFEYKEITAQTRFESMLFGKHIVPPSPYEKMTSSFNKNLLK